MEFALYYTAAGIILYFAADWILNRIEIAYGERFKYRSVIFFVIITALALTLGYFFSLTPPPVEQSPAPSQAPPAEQSPPSP